VSVFSPGGGTTTSSGGGGSTISTGLVVNQTAVAANIEYSYTVPAGTKYFRLKTRDNAVLQISYTALTTGTTYKTIWPGDEYEPPFEIDTAVTLYYRSSKAGTVLEIELWS
jgi:hypothetical protein